MARHAEHEMASTSGTHPGHDPVRRLESDAFQRVPRRRLADEIVQQIRTLVAEECLEAGTRLPSERELAARCGASRAVVAQALRTLSLMGLVEIRPGSGAFVARNPQSLVSASVALMADLHPGSLHHLCELRLWLETDGALGALAQRAEARPGAAGRELEADLESALGKLGSSPGVSAFAAADTNFHARLVAGAGNPYLTALYESVHTEILSVEYAGWVRSDDAPAWLALPHVEDHLRLHRAMLAALSHGDADAMRRALVDHHEAMLTHLGLRAEGDPHGRQEDFLPHTT